MPQQIMVVQKREKRVKTWNSKNRISKTQIMAILRIREKNPKVKIFKGKVILSKIGLIKKLISPKMPPTKTRICQL